MAPAVRIRGLRKRYGEAEAVRAIDLEVESGEIFAFLGPNGAGKTTTVEILEGFRPRDEGEVAVLGVDPRDGKSDWRDRIGIVLQDSAPEPGLTVRESLMLYAGYFTRPRSVEETISLIGLEAKRNARAVSLSGGQRRRLDFGLALIGDPELIFLDEPTTGFDPSARRAAWDVISGLRALGKTIFLTTHYMDEAERLADRIAVIVAGQIVAQGTPATLGGRDHAAAVISFGFPKGWTLADFPQPLVDRATVTPHGGVEMRTDHPLADMELLARWSREHALDIPDLALTRPTLEDIYLQLTAPETGT